MRRRSARGDCEIGISVTSFANEAQQRRRTIRRRRLRTACMATLCVCACALHMALRHLQTRVAAAAIASKEPCAPLFGAVLPAIVVMDLATKGVAPMTTLWWPHYSKNASDSATELIRTKESSKVCPTTVARIRPKTLTFKNMFGKAVTLQGKQAVCVAHLTDFFAKKTCFY